MRKIDIHLGDRSYSIVVGRNLLSSIGGLFKPLRLGSKILVVSNRQVAGLFLSKVRPSLTRGGYQVTEPYLLPYGDERDKSKEVLLELWEHMAKIQLERTSTLLALGGGVVGDVAGFAASTYMRGITLIQVPTTLLAQVDSAIGGKTAINLSSAKNIIGTFYQPRLVAADLETLLEPLKRKNLREAWLKELRNSFAEVIKYGMIQDCHLFQLLEEKSDWFFESLREGRAGATQYAFLELVVTRSVQVKAKVVESDERETKGRRMILNYGHTFGHAFEAASNFRIPHGEAVALGMAAAARLASRKKMLPREHETRQNQLIRKMDLPTNLNGYRLDRERVVHHLLLDKKKRESQIRLVLPETIGRVRVVGNVSLGEIKDILTELGGK